MSLLTRVLVAAAVLAAFHSLVAPLQALPAVCVAVLTVYVGGPSFGRLGRLAARVEHEAALRDMARTIDRVLAAEDVGRARKLCARIMDSEGSNE